MRWSNKVSSLLVAVAGLVAAANVASAEPNKNQGQSRGVSRSSGNLSSVNKTPSFTLGKPSSIGMMGGSPQAKYQPKHPGNTGYEGSPRNKLTVTDHQSQSFGLGVKKTQDLKFVEAPKGTGGFKPLGPGGSPIEVINKPLAPLQPIRKDLGLGGIKLAERDSLGDRGISDRVGTIKTIPGLGLGNGPVKKLPDLGIGKGPKIPLDPGIGNGKGPKIPLDPGIGNGKGPIKKLPIDLGFGKGPKIPICPPHKHPKYPCPSHCHDWCWFPCFGHGFGYSNGFCFSTVVVQEVIVEVPVVIESLPQLVPGTTIVVAGQNLGLDKGQVLVQVGGIALPAEIVAWEMDKVTIVLPMVALMAPTKAELLVLRADGSMARKMPFEFVAGVMQQPDVQ